MKAKATKKYTTLRINLIRSGYTLRSFAKKFGFNERTVYAAAKGERFGVQSARILNKLKEFTQC